MRRAFTLVELLVVIAIIGILIALLLPAVQAAREAARRLQCSNNLKQLALAALNYENSFRALPPMGFSIPGDSSWHDVSWIVRILPYFEQGALHEGFQYNDSDRGWPGQSPATRALIDNVRVATLQCPSSTLPESTFWASTNAGEVTVPHATYTGIAGANMPGFSPGDTNHPTLYARTVWGHGYGSRHGAFEPNRAVRMMQICDGTTNTVLIGEQSGWMIDPSTGARVDRRADCTHGFQGGYYHGDRYINVNVVLYGLNERNANLDGVGGNCGPNSPLHSAHPGVVLTAMVDGSVRGLNETLDHATLLNLCNRDSGNIISLE